MIRLRLAVVLATVAALLPAPAHLGAAATTATSAPTAASSATTTAGPPPAGPEEVHRRYEPVVLTGAQLGSWASAAATGVAAPYPSGTPSEGEEQVPFVDFPLPPGDDVRSAHNGTITVPPDAGTGVPVEEIVAFRWDGTTWVEVPVQVDERYPYFLANARSGFSWYSGTDTELTYAFTSTGNTIGEERWKRMFGECEARFATDLAEVEAANAAGWLVPGQGETLADYLTSMPDPVPGLDADDEVVFIAGDAGSRAPAGVAGPPGTLAGPDARLEIALTDPLEPGIVRYLYLFRRPGGSSFDHTNGYVEFAWHPDADTYLDRDSFAPDDPEKIGTSNRGYGPNLPGTVCVGPDGPTAPRPSTDRMPKDALTVRTDAYQWTASGRWMIRSLEVARPGQPATPPGVPHEERTRSYGPDLIDRWKGRAFQQSPDSAISLVGFEDEQVNWELNSATLGWRVGPVRAIREIWGADSGTNVTKTEYFYPDSIAYRYRVRVHPIPPDGLYTSWDYNHDVAAVYYNIQRPDGVPIDGVNDDVGNVDGIDFDRDGTIDFPAFFDATDPTFDVPSAIGRWEQVSGRDDAGSLVYTLELSGATSPQNAAAVPYYRDDACLDDGTGDDPVPRPWPGEPSDDPRVRDGYAAYWGVPYEELGCDAADQSKPAHQRFGFQGAFGTHGLHVFYTGDTDNLTVGAPVPINELDATQWQFAVPTRQPTNVGWRYANRVLQRLQPTVTPQANTPGPPLAAVAKAGAAAVDSTWHVGASAGQYASNGVSVGDHGSDPFAHSTRRTPSYGLQGRESIRALVLEGANGQRWALVSNDLYIPQDLVNQRVAAILEEHDQLVDLGLAPGPRTGITRDNLTIAVSHSHSSPYYSTPSWGVWAFQDVFDLRFFEHVARRMADAVIAAAADLRPARFGAAAGPVDAGKRHSFGPTSADDGTPAGYPETDRDPDLTVLRFDDAATGEPIATWFVYGLHPEMLDGNDLLTSEYVVTTAVQVDREVGGVTLWSQNDTGTAEPDRDGRAHPPVERQEFSHREYAQMQRLARMLADAVITLRADLDRVEAAGGDLAAAELATSVAIDDTTGSVFDTDFVVGVRDVRLSPPGYRLFPSVSNCRAHKTFDGNPGVPIVGLPDCEYVFGSQGTNPAVEALPPELRPGTTYRALQEAGVPIPDNVMAPSYTGLQETLAVHLQAIRIGDVGVTVCPCEQWADQSRNIKSRLNATPGDLWYGFDWTANYRDNGPDGDYRDTSGVWRAGVRYDGTDGPLTLNDTCVPADDGGWQCGWPARGDLQPVSDETFRRMKAQIYNDARGWDELTNSFEAEAEPADPALIWGNYTHEEIGDGRGDNPTDTARPYDLVATVGMANDYWGYIVTYREFQRGDHYRKALTGLGPHSSDWLATRLARMAAALNGGLDHPSITPGAKDAIAQADSEHNHQRARAIGEHAETYLPVYEASLPPDGPGPARITDQPADVERFDAAVVRWVGGSNYTDTPRVVVQRCIDDPCDPADPADWQDFADTYGEVQLRLRFPTPDELPAVRAGTFEWIWEAQFEAFDGDVPWTMLDGQRYTQIPDGTYRFVIDGCRREPLPGSGPTPGDPDDPDCPAYDPTGRVAPYHLVSDPFEVRPSGYLTVEDIRRDPTDQSVVVDVGPEFPFPIAYTAVDPDPDTDYVDAPDSYQSIFRTRTTGIGDSPIPDGPEPGFIRDREPGDLRTYTDPRRFTGDPEVFCFHCSFRPWVDVAAVASVTVTVERYADGTVEEVPAVFELAGGSTSAGVWRAPVALEPGDRAWVAVGGVRDEWGERNGQASAEVVRPLLELSDVTADEASPVVLTATLVAEHPGPHTFEWDLGDGTTVTTTAPTVTHTYADDGVYTVTVTVPEESDDGTTPLTATATATIANLPPTLAPLADRTVGVGRPVSFAASATDPAGDRDPLTFTWDFGDGSPLEVGQQVTHTYSATGTYTVTVTVEDGDGGVDATSATVTVVEGGPADIDPGGPYTGSEGSPVTFTATATPSGGGTLTFSWDFGDGSPPAEGASVAHTYAADGDYTVTLTVTETGGSTPGVGTAQTVAHIANVAPTVAVSGPSEVDEGAAITFTATVSDPGADDTSSAVVWLVDGVVVGDGPELDWTAPDGPAEVTIVARATDSDGAVGEATHPVAVRNVAPEVGVDGPTEADEGTPVTFVARADDPGGDAVTFTWTVDGVVQDETGPTLMVAFPEGPGTGRVEVVATDDDGGVSDPPGVIDVDVRNVAPTVTIAGPAGVDEGSQATYTAEVDDPGVEDTHTLRWLVDGVEVVGADPDRGLEVTDGGRRLVVTGLDGPDLLDVRVEVTDDDGGAGAATKGVLVANVPPTVDAGPDRTAVVGETLTFTGSATDPAGDRDPLTFTWDLGDGTTRVGRTVTHTYREAGTYRVRLVVDDGDDGRGLDELEVVVSAAAAGEPGGEPGGGPGGGAGGGPGGGPGGGAVRIVRHAGEDRIGTAVAVSRDLFASARVVVLARADLPPDALAGAPLAARLGAPLLLARRDELPAEVAAEIRRLGAAQAVLLGGEDALSPAVEGALRAMGLGVERIAGADRFATAAAVASRLGGTAVYVAKGADPDPDRAWPDALAVSGLAAAEQRPILLVGPGVVPEPTRRALEVLGVRQVTVVGGEAAVSAEVAAALAAGGRTLDRLAGSDRYGTSRAVAERTVAAGAGAAARPWLATGLDWPDALVAGPAVAADGGVLLLIDGRGAADGNAQAWVTRYRPELVVVHLVGGPAAISTAVEEGLRTRLES